MSIKKTREAKRLIESMAPEGEFLAYINPEEAQMLKNAGGSGIMTAAGIPSFVNFGGPGSGYGSAQDTFDSAGGRGGSRTGPGGGKGPSRSDTGTTADEVYQSFVEASQPKTLGEKIVDSIKSISKFSPIGLITKGLGSLFNKFGTFAQNLRGFNPDGTPRTQAQFEAARRQRQLQNRISNIMGRDAPFTAKTIENLEKLYDALGQNVPSNINESLIGTTNVTRSATPDDVFPNRAEGIVTQAPQTFREAMAALNLERGVPKDQVFLSAKDFINQDIAQGPFAMQEYFNVPIEERMATSAGVPKSAVQLTKTFNTPQELQNLGVLEDTLFGGKKLTDQGKVLEDFRRQATKMRDAEMSPTYQQGVGSQLNRMLGMPGLMGDIIENKDFIQSAIDKGFLSEPSDFQNQKPFEDIL